MKKKTNRKTKLEALAKEFMPAMIAKHPPILNAGSDIYTEIALGAFSYAEAFLRISENK